MEKIVSSLVVVARRLHPYFLAYSITVLTNHLFKQILGKVEVFGRPVKWAIELGEYDLIFSLKLTIKLLKC